MSTFPRRFWTWWSGTQNIQLYNKKIQRQNSGREIWSIFQWLEVRSESESSFWVHLKKQWRRMIQMLFRTREQNPAGSIQTCVHEGRLDNSKGYPQKNWRHRVVHKEEDDYKAEFLQIDELNCVCRFTQRRTYGFQGRCLTKTSTKKPHNQLSHVWVKDKTAV